MLIATDLDGTLVPNDSIEVSPRTAAALRQADTAGIPVVFVTARPLRWMEAFWPFVGSHGIAIVSNGAITYDVAAQSARDVHGIDSSLGLRICEAVKAIDIDATFAIECADGIHLDERYIEGNPSGPETPRGNLAELWTDPAVKLLIRTLNASDSEGFRDRVVEAVGPLATATWSTNGLIEVSAPGVDKASALQRLCAQLGIHRSDVIAFGDMPNDIPMLTWAGTPYAVANADPSVQAVATAVAPRCVDDGVAQVLETMLGAA